MDTFTHTHTHIHKDLYIQGWPHSSYMICMLVHITCTYYIYILHIHIHIHITYTYTYTCCILHMHIHIHTHTNIHITYYIYVYILDEGLQRYKGINSYIYAYMHTYIHTYAYIIQLIWCFFAYVVFHTFNEDTGCIHIYILYVLYVWYVYIWDDPFDFQTYVHVCM